MVSGGECSCAWLSSGTSVALLKPSWWVRVQSYSLRLLYLGGVEEAVAVDLQHELRQIVRRLACVRHSRGARVASFTLLGCKHTCCPTDMTSSSWVHVCSCVCWWNACMSTRSKHDQAIAHVTSPSSVCESRHGCSVNHVMGAGHACGRTEELEGEADGDGEGERDHRRVDPRLVERVRRAYSTWQPRPAREVCVERGRAASARNAAARGLNVRGVVQVASMR